MFPSSDVREVRACCERLRSLVTNLEPAEVRAEDAAVLVEAFSQVEKLGAAGRSLAASRVAKSQVWKREGDRSPAHWMARKAGVPVGQAAASLETVARLDELTQVDTAFREGRLSVAQANDVASAAAADPSAESELLSMAATDTVAGLREQARRVRAAASADEEARYDAIHRRRYLRHYTDPDGAFRLDGLLTPDAGASFLAELDTWRTRVFNDARAAGVRDRYDAYTADALVAMARAGQPTGEIRREEPRSTTSAKGSREPTGSARSGPRAVVHVHVDHQALVRGRTMGGEICEIPGIGPIPVAVAREIANDSILKVLVTDGADIKAVAHPGRTIPAHLRTALEARDRECCVPTCHVREGLEIDHLQPFAEGGPTRLDNLARLCHWHHRQKSLHGWTLTGAPGDWRWRPPALGELHEPRGAPIEPEAPTLALSLPP